MSKEHSGCLADKELGCVKVSVLAAGLVYRVQHYFLVPAFIQALLISSNYYTARSTQRHVRLKSFFMPRR